MKIILKNLMPEIQHPVNNIPQGRIPGFSFAQFGPKWNSNSSPLAKGDPVLGISGLDPHILAFSTPENAPTEITLGLEL
jgi:hypothetical protein